MDPPGGPGEGIDRRLFRGEGVSETGPGDGGDDPDAFPEQFRELLRVTVRGLPRQPGQVVDAFQRASSAGRTVAEGVPFR